MRTTVTLEQDVEAMVQQLMPERNLTFKAAVNEAIRAGLRPRPTSTRLQTPTFALGQPTVALAKALDVAVAMEDDELIRTVGLDVLERSDPSPAADTARHR